MRLAPFLKQTASWEKKTGQTEGWSTATYAPPEQIKVRRTSKTKLLKSQNQTTLVDVTKYLTEATLQIGDKVDGGEIMAVEDIHDISGKRLGCKAYPRPPQGFTP